MREIKQLRACGDPVKAVELAAYHKVPRVYLGVSVPVIDEMARGWRAGLDVTARVDLAARLWASDIHEARVAAAKVLTQARIREDEPVWRLIVSWLPDFDGWSIADHVMGAGARRMAAAPERLDEVEEWLNDSSFWVRRAALVGTLPWTRLRNPRPADLMRREQVFGWLGRLADDREWFIQKAIGWWLRDLSKHDPQRVRDWLEAHGSRLKPFARREAARWLPENRRRADQP